MKHVIIFCCLIFFSLCSWAEGISFDQNLSWAAIKEKAKREHKYIFVDCYASWCGPCKKMDKEVYVIDSIGAFMHDNFVNVKFQIDTSNTDNREIKQHYADAHELLLRYGIIGFPTYLFFSPDGNLVHKGMGFLAADLFKDLAQSALNPAKQYFTLLAKFEKHQLLYSAMPGLVDMANGLQDFDHAKKVATAYINGYLVKLDKRELYSPVNLAFLGTWARSSKDPGFRMYYEHGKTIDSILNQPGVSEGVVDNIIEMEEINRKIYKNGESFDLKGAEPDWAMLKGLIEQKYGDATAAPVVLWAKIKYLESKKRWPEYCKAVIEKVDQYGPYCKFYPYTAMGVEQRWNFSAWELFSFSKDSNDLKIALQWSDSAINHLVLAQPGGDYLDTHANILYKLGRTDEAIAEEEKAASMHPLDAKGVNENLRKMKAGLPTWGN